MKTMQNKVTNNKAIEKDITKPSFPIVTETVFFYGKCTQFCNYELGVTGKFQADSGKLEVKFPFKKGEYLSFVELFRRRQIAFVKQPNKNCPLPINDPNWHKKQINSNKDIPSVCQDLCHYDEENEYLTISMSIGNDYALDYGTYIKTRAFLVIFLYLIKVIFVLLINYLLYLHLLFQLFYLQILLNLMVFHI